MTRTESASAAGLGLGASGEYFHRRSYYQAAGGTIKTYHYPQLRAYLTWGNR